MEAVGQVDLAPRGMSASSAIDRRAAMPWAVRISLRVRAS
jgi:hypothetical protein